MRTLVKLVSKGASTLAWAAIALAAINLVMYTIFVVYLAGTSYGSIDMDVLGPLAVCIVAMPTLYLIYRVFGWASYRLDQAEREDQIDG